MTDLIGALVQTVLEILGAWPRKGRTWDELAAAARTGRKVEQDDLPVS